ncbi:MAG TPA: hypothetical protein VEH04_19780 [Verrucomicrobiae bacterium]|nr:hypothetical protein [Verrucomicrobiae bacterium]
MEDLLQFGSRDYCLCFLLLLFGRGMDFISTWVATPNLVLEGNPIAKKLGWHGGLLVNLAACWLLAFSAPVAIGVSTMSVLVAARNFQSAWLMRSMGEENYRDWHVARITETPVTLYLSCLAGNTLLTALVGGALVLFSDSYLIPTSIGMGMLAYSFAVVLFTLLGVWRSRRAMNRRLTRRSPQPAPLPGDGFVK